MATTIPGWAPKFIRQVVAYREKQKVTHERLNELFNLLIVQGDWNTETMQTLLANLKSFDLQYIADLDGMSADYVALVSTFNNTINQIKQENTSNIATLDLQQRQLMAEQLITFQADLADAETAINTMLTDKLGAIQILHDEMLAQSDFFNTEMADLRLTVDTLRATILDDNQAIANKIAADRLAIETMIAISQETVQHASDLTQAITNLETTTAEHEHTLGEYDSRLLGLALENVDQDTALNTLNNNLAKKSMLSIVKDVQVGPGENVNAFTGSSPLVIIKASYSGEGFTGISCFKIIMKNTISSVIYENVVLANSSKVTSGFVAPSIADTFTQSQITNNDTNVSIRVVVTVLSL